MYKIVKDTQTVTVVSNPVWVKMQDNGSFTLCDAAEAQGVVVEGVVYHISNTPEIAGHDTVIISEISETAYHNEIAAAQQEKQLQTDSALAELSILIASAMPTT